MTTPLPARNGPGKSFPSVQVLLKHMESLIVKSMLLYEFGLFLADHRIVVCFSREIMAVNQEICVRQHGLHAMSAYHMNVQRSKLKQHRCTHQL